MPGHLPIDYQSPKDKRSPESVRQSAKATALAGLLVNLVGTGLICILWAGLWWIPRGTSIRPMALAFFTFVNVLVNTVVGCSSGITAAWVGRKHPGACLLGVMTALLGLIAPIALPCGMIWFAVVEHGIVFSP